MEKLLTWDIYEISSETEKLEGVMLRGRIRKFTILNNINLLTENSSDKENVVRFAIPNKTNPKKIIAKINEMIPDTKVELVKEKVKNPVLSKLKVNQEERYTI